MKDAINYIREVHKKNIDIQSLAFQNFYEFVSWNQEEKKRHANYVLMCAPQTFQTHKHNYYYCNRRENTIQREKINVILKYRAHVKLVRTVLHT